MNPWFGFDHDEKRLYPIASSLRQYARIRGWTERQLDQIGDDPCSFGLTGLSMLQSMLFFGVWESIIGNSISSRDFLLGPPTDLKLSSKNLRSLIQQTDKILHSSRPLSKSEQIYTTMKEVELWQNILLDHHPVQFSLLISVLRRQTALNEDALWFLYCCIPCNIRRNYAKFHHLNVNEGFYRDLLRENGFCPSYYEYLDYAGISAIEYFCVAGPTNKSISDHLSCNNTMCLETRTVLGVDKANHLESDCVCQSVSILSTRVREILVSGNYFVIDITRLLDMKSSHSEAIVPYHSGLTYVAFSHVWSHGLGNIADQGLPVCRLRYLRNLIFSLKATFGRITHFWIDAMCIPEDTNLKKKSIGLMDQVYRNSTVVMALDVMLQTLLLDDLSYEMLAITILLSDWNRRLWTFQEAKLATTLVIVLKNRWISIQALYNVLSGKISDGHGSPVTLSCAQQLACLTEYATGLFEWMPLLQFRSCSVSTDEPLVISALTGLDTHLLVQEEGDFRMAKFWALLGRVPSGILFHASPKLKVESYRWAPRSLICGSNETGVAGVRQPDSDVTRDGLRASLFTVDFREEPILLDSTAPTVIVIQGVRLTCRNRDEEMGNSTQSLAFDALAFARDPLVHRVVLPNTLLSAVALKWTSSTPDVTCYTFILPILAKVERFPSTGIKNRAATKKTILIS